MKLYPFQREAVEVGIQSIIGSDNILISSPTGSGKSLCELALMHEIQRSLGLSCGMITSQREIADGIIEKGEKMGIPTEHRIWTPQKFWNQLENKRVRMPQVLIVDECLHPDTLVLTTTGTRAIGDLKIGDQVITPYGTPTTVTKVTRRVKEAVRLVSSQGRWVISSEDHKFLEPRGEGSFCGGNPRTGTYHEGAVAVTKKRRVVRRKPCGVPASELTHFWTAPTDLILAWNSGERKVNPDNYLYGWFLGDGCYDKNAKSITFGFSKDLEAFHKILTEVVGLKPDVDFKVYDTYRADPETGQKKLEQKFDFSTEATRKYVSQWKAKPGPKANTCSINEDLYLAADRDVIRGLFDAEGCRHQDRISIDMTSEVIIKQLQCMLHRWGVVCTYNSYKKKRKRKDTGEPHAPRHRLLICGENINRFNRLVGWGLKRKLAPHRKCWSKGAVYGSDKIVHREHLGTQELVDITVDDPEHFFVLANGIMSQNCHHSLARTWQRLWKRTSYEGDNIRVVGLTATPMRGVEYENPQWKTLFHRFHEAITITEAIKQNYLANFYILKDTVGMLGEQQIETARAQDQIAADAIEDKMDVIGDVVMALDRKRPTVFITPTVAAATSVATYFKYHHPEIPVEPIVGTTSKKRRKTLMKKLAQNKVWCAAVNLMTEGIDIPEISRVVNLRPSVSPIPYVQGLGRGLRLVYRNGKPDLRLKRYCEYIDFTNNLFRFGTKLRDVLGIRFEENQYHYTPDLDFVPPPENKMTIVDDYINFRYSPTEAKPITAYLEGQEVLGKVGSTTGNDWAIRLFMPGNKSDVYVLERTSGLWKKKTASVQPKDFLIELGSTRDEILTLGARMGRGFKQIGDESVSLGELLLFGLLRQLVSESRELTEDEQEAYLISRKFLTLIPGPRILRERAV